MRLRRFPLKGAPPAARRSRFRGGAGLGSASFYGQSALLMAFIDHALVVITFNGRAPVI